MSLNSSVPAAALQYSFLTQFEEVKYDGDIVLVIVVILY